MMITHKGDFVVGRPPREVFDFLTDPERFAPLLPHFESVERQPDGSFVVKLKVGVSHIRGTATVRLKLEEKEPPRKATYRGTGSLAGGTVNLGAGFELDEVAEGTRVNWSGQAQVFGRIASIARGLLEPLTKRNIQALIDSLQGALSGPE